MIDVTTLNFFQKQYLTIFKNKSVKKKAEVYHEMVRFVLEEQYPPQITDLLIKFPNRSKTILRDLKYLEDKRLLIKFKFGDTFRFVPTLMPFVSTKETQEEVYNLFEESPQYSRGIKLRDKVNEILDGSKQDQIDEWSSTFQNAGYTDGKDFAPKKTADDYSKSELPPNFDDTENSSGMVVV